MQRYISKNEQDTREIAIKLAKTLKGGECICFFGQLGAGKTAFVKGIASWLNVNDPITSPTFAIVHEHTGRLNLYHFDMYRITNEDELYSTGFYDYMNDNSVFCIEWSENIRFALPDSIIKVCIEYTDNENERIITIERVSK